MGEGGVSDPDYRGFRITELHAICGIDDNDEEAIPAIWTVNGPMPLISSDRVRLEQTMAMAQKLSDWTGKTYKIVKFSVREDIGEIKPKRQS